jgi:hypothetical protein
VREYDLFIPMFFNDGTRIDPATLAGFEERLLNEFNGLTIFPQPNQGYWRYGGVTYQDEIIIYRVIATNQRSARRFLRNFREELKRALEQEEILIIERDVETL